MVVGVISDRMSRTNQTLKQQGVFSDVIADTEKGSLGLIQIQYLQYRLRNLRNRSIVESKIDYLSISWDLP